MAWWLAHRAGARPTAIARYLDLPCPTVVSLYLSTIEDSAASCPTLVTMAGVVERITNGQSVVRSVCARLRTRAVAEFCASVKPGSLIVGTAKYVARHGLRYEPTPPTTKEITP